MLASGVAAMRALVLVVALGGIGASAAAQDRPSHVVFERPACAELPFDWDAFVSLLSIELEEDGIDGLSDVEAEGSLATLRLVVACDTAEALEIVRVEIEDHATRKHVARDFDLLGVPDASRARTLALGTAELLRASWAELAMPDVPAPMVEVPDSVRDAVRVSPRHLLGDPRGSMPEPAPAEEDARAAAEVAIRGGLAARVLASGNATLAGGFLHADVRVHPLLAVRLGGSAGYASSVHPLGETELVGVLGLVGLAIEAHLDVLRLALVPAIELGWGRAAGRSARTDVIASAGDAVVSVARIDAEGTVVVAGPLEAHVGLGLGYTLAGVRALAEGAPFAGITGASVHIDIGLGLRLP